MLADRVPAFAYKLLLILATVIWGLSFIVMKEAVSVMEPAWLIGVRFLLTAAVLTVVFLKNVRTSFNKDHLIKGSILGVLLFLAFWAQTIGLAHTTPGRNAFLTATYCVIVPFFTWFLTKRRPTIFNVAAAVLCVMGIGFVSLSSASEGASAVAGSDVAGQTISLPTGVASSVGLSSILAPEVAFGDFMTVVCAVFFAVHIVYVSRFSEGRDVLSLTVWQFWAGGLCGIVVGVVAEPAPDMSLVTPDFLFNLAYLVVFASCVALVIQNVALAHVPPAQGSLFLSLESVFGVLFSVLLYGERLTAPLLFGFALIFAAIVVSEVLPAKTGKIEGWDSDGENQQTHGAG